MIIRNNLFNAVPIFDSGITDEGCIFMYQELYNYRSVFKEDNHANRISFI